MRAGTLSIENSSVSQVGISQVLCYIWS